MDFSVFYGKYPNSNKKIAGFVGGTKDRIERASFVVLSTGQQAVIAGFRKRKPHILGEICLMLAVDLLKGDIESRDDSGGESLIDHEIIFGVIKLEVDYLVDPLRVVLPQIIKIIEHLRVDLHLSVSHPRWEVMYIIPSLVLIAAVW